MQIPPQEDWSPELLSELQRAVPVLESSSFEMGIRTDTRSGIADWPSVRSGAEGFASFAGAANAAFSSSDSARGLADTTNVTFDGTPTDLLSEDAMSLPMSTLTSGRRRTYPNKGSFQAHVCCVMDPLQVPCILERLKAAPQFGHARSWPHAYRIISPFDGQTREGYEDDDDPGAGEKMLSLLSRMGLENLLLIVTHWDTGATNRLGAELFGCVNEQCKHLLLELQQAVRASFPPDEFYSGQERYQEMEVSVCGESVDDAWYEPSREMGYDYDSEEYAACEPSECGWHSSRQASLTTPRTAVEPKVFPLAPLGMAPPAALLWAERGVLAPAVVSARGAARSKATCGNSTVAEHSSTAASRGADKARVNASCSSHGLRVRRCELRRRDSSNCGRLAMAGARVVRNKGNGLGSSRPSEANFQAGAHGASDSANLEAMSDEELVRLCIQMRSDRARLGGSLDVIGMAARD